TNLQKKAKGGDALAKTELALCEKLKPILDSGKPARSLKMDDAEKSLLKSFHLLTSKPQLYVCNVNEEDAAKGNALTEKVAAKASAEGAQIVIISAAIEQEIAQLVADEQKEFLDSLGLTEPGLNKVIRAGYALVNLITYFTTGPKETRAWTVRKGAKAPEAAGVIHNDFERGFIRAETIAYNDFIALGGEQACKDAGKMRAEGKEYVVNDCDIMLFRFNV